MQFDKEVLFIGTKEMVLKDGTVMNTVTFYVDADTVDVNVLASNVPVMSAVRSLSFGDKAHATFALRKRDNVYRLSLAGLA